MFNRTSSYNTREIKKYAILSFAVFSLALYLKNEIVVSAVVSVSFIILLVINYKAALVLYFTSFYITEAVWVEIAGGIFRPYHFMTFILLLVYMPELLNLLRRSTNVNFLLFLFWAFLCSLLSNSTSNALNSFLSLLINAVIVFPVAIIVREEYLTLREVKTTLLVSFIIILFVGYLQFFLNSAFGIHFLGITEYQVSNIKAGLMVGYCYESNGFGKQIAFLLIFFLYDILNNSKDKPLYRVLFILSVGTFILSATRSAAYALIIMMIFMLLFSKSHKLKLGMLNYVFILLGVVGILIILIQIGVIELNSYSLYKFNNFFVKDFRSDGSAAIRSEAMFATINAALSNIRVFFMGQGWGVAFYQSNVRNGIEMLGGNDLMAILAFSGVIGLILYCRSCLRNFSVFNHYANLDDEYRDIYYSLANTSLFMLIFGMFSGMINYAPLYMLNGLCMFIPKPQKYSYELPQSR